ncbi:MAG TPA: DNA-3-methyladenine glycosylase I [Azospira sp.]|nr:DNA-3-methyladenine glycosylase I [Azospira sp.]
MPCRCAWVSNDPLYTAYHDKEWGVPLTDDRRLFEFLILEGAQAGLSWITILRKRENYRRALDDFDAEKIASYDETRLAALLADPGIVRNRLKVKACVANARAYLETRAAHGSFAAYLWDFVDGRPRQNQWSDLSQVPSRTAQSDAMSKDLARRGFKFVGSTICYAFMQATGMVNDHTTDCFRHGEVARLGQRDVIITP